MKTRLFVVLMISIGLWSSGLAQIDPDPDGMSVYFDLGATDYCAYLQEDSYCPVTAYLILTHPSTEQSHILAWEARLEIEGNPIVPIPSAWTLVNNDCWWCSGPDYIVGTSTPPLPITGTATMLASITLSFIGDEIDPYAVFTIGRCTGSTTFPEGAGYTSEVGHPIPCQHIFGAWGTPCAWINPVDCHFPIANKTMTWGAMKALY